MKKNRILRTLSEYFQISFGLLLYVVAWIVFIFPNHLVGGGVTGISTIINYATGINVGISYFVINAFLLLLGFKILGSGFGLKTIYAILFITAAFQIVPPLIPAEFIQQIAVDNGKMLCVIVGGCMSALGTSLAIRCGGSSGGTDIIALMVSKFYNISTGTMIVLMDILIISSSLLLPSDATWGSRFADVVYGFIDAAVFSIALDFFLTGSKQSVQMLIFSDNYIKIADRLIGEENRGVSVFDAQGWYAKKDRKVLMVVVHKTDMNRLLSVIKEEDPSAFVSVGSVQGVYGMGFDTIKK